VLKTFALVMYNVHFRIIMKIYLKVQKNPNDLNIFVNSYSTYWNDAKFFCNSFGLCFAIFIKCCANKIDKNLTIPHILLVWYGAKCVRNVQITRQFFALHRCVNFWSGHAFCFVINVAWKCSKLFIQHWVWKCHTLVSY